MYISRRSFFSSFFNYLRLKDDDSEVLRMLDYNETVIGSRSSIVDTLFDDDVVEGSNLYGPVCCAALLMFTLWYRKRQYDEIGIHKKFEVDFPWTLLRFNINERVIADAEQATFQLYSNIRS